MERLKEYLHKYIQDPLDPYINAELGQEYENIGQGAAALSYFLRASELTHDTDPILAYNGILKTWLQLNKTTRRANYEKGQLETVIAYLPTRPEGYLFLCKWYSSRKDWKTANLYADLGLQHIGKEPLPYDIGYKGDWELKFQKAFVCWYIGQRDKSHKLWLELYNDPYVDENHRELVINNCINFDLIKERPVLTTWHDLLPYKKTHYKTLSKKFKGANLVEENYSQCYQDLFALTALNGKKNGTYLEIGAGHPTYGNNTLLLTQWGWKGASLDISKEFIEEWKKRRSLDTILDQNSLSADYLDIADNYIGTRQIDYLQLDVDPAYNTYRTLERIPFDKLEFGVITYEHDYYCDNTKSYKSKSQQLLTEAGYVLVAENISPDENSPYEDWWVHSKYVKNVNVDIGKRVLYAKNYILNNKN